MSEAGTKIVDSTFDEMDENEKRYVVLTVWVNRLIFLGIGALVASGIALLIWFIRRRSKQKAEGF